MKNILISFGLLLTILALTTNSSYAGEPTINKDLVISDYKTILLEQGKSKVYPTFKIINNGSKTYKDIRLIYSSPKGLSSNGKNVKLERVSSDWASVTLQPGQEVTFNPSNQHYTYLRASSNQAITTYSTDYYFYFKDENGHEYTTPYKTIDKFIEVIPFNNDINVSSFSTIIMEQGKSKVYPTFKIKNNGSKTYKDIKLIYSSPKGLSFNGKNVKLERVSSDWASVTLQPGQEVTFNPSNQHYTYLRASSNQAITTYSTDYYFYFKDEDGHEYTTPYKTIDKFVKVIQFNNDINVSSFSTIIMEQGKSKVYPTFKIKNNGSKAYKNIKLIYSSPKGLSSHGKNVKLERVSSDWAYVTLRPGQEVTFNPSNQHYTYLRASSNQAITTYSTNYYFYFKDEDGHEYTTPYKTIDQFVQVIPAGGKGSVKEYQQEPKSNKPNTSSILHSSTNEYNLDIHDALNNEISNLETIVHPKHLEGLKNILKQLNMNTERPVSTKPKSVSISSSDENQQQFQKDAMQYGLDMINPLKSSQDVKESYEQFKNSAEKALND
jgi:D-lyxose ketol-isomerase